MGHRAQGDAQVTMTAVARASRDAAARAAAMDEADVWSLAGAVEGNSCWLTDRQLTFLLSKGPGLRTIGLEDGEVVGQTLLDLCVASSVPSGVAYPMIRAHLRALGGEVVKYEGRWQGSEYDAWVAPWRVDGTIIGCVGFSVFSQAPERSRYSSELARPNLTPRQIEILHLLEDGLSTAGIAQRLVLQECTVKNHVARILHRMGAHTRLEAVARAERRNHLDRMDCPAPRSSTAPRVVRTPGGVRDRAGRSTGARTSRFRGAASERCSCM